MARSDFNAKKWECQEVALIFGNDFPLLSVDLALRVGQEFRQKLDKTKFQITLLMWQLL